MSRPVRTWTLVLAELRHRAGLPLVTAAVVLVLVAVVVGWPRVVDDGATAQARHDVAASSPTQRDLVAAAAAPLPVGPATTPQPDVDADVAAVWGGVIEAFAQQRAAMPEPLRSVTTPARFTVRLDPLDVASAPGSDVRTARLALALDPALEGDVRMVDGAWPAASDWDGVEVALADASARRLDWEVGTERALTDPEGRTTTVRLAGTYAALDPGAPDWQERPYSLAPQEVDDLNAGVGVLAAAYVDPTSVALLGTAAERTEVIGFVDGVLQTRLVEFTVAVPSSSRAWYPVDPERVEGGSVDALLARTRAFTAAPVVLPGEPAVPDAQDGVQVASSLTFSSGLGDTLESVDAQLAAARTVLAVVAAGPLVAGAAVLVLSARLTAGRRSTRTALLVARGASRGRVRTLGGLSAAVLVVPATVLGVVLGLVLTPGDSRVAAVVQDSLPGVVVGAAAMLLAIALATHGLAGATTGARRPGLAGGGRLRVVVDGALLVLALLAVGACLRGPAVGTDPWVVAAPVLCVLAATAWTLRVYPWLLARLERSAHRATGLVAFLGAARAVRAPAGGFWPALALVLGVWVTVFSAGLSTTLGAGVAAQGWATVGADVRVSGPVVDDEDAARLAAVDGVQGVARVADLGTLVLRGPSTGERTSTLAVDTAALRDVQADVPGAARVPAALAETVDGRLPVLVPRALGVVPGTTGLRLTAQQGADVEVIGYSDGLSGLGTGRSTVVVDRALAGDALDLETRPRLVLVAASDPGPVADAVRDVVPDALVTTHDDVVDEVLDAPVAAGVAHAFVVASVLAAVLAVLALVLAQVAAAPGRARLAAVLAALGAPRRTLRRVVAWETWPWLLVAVVVGVAAGVTTPWLVTAATDLTPFTGGTAPEPAVDLLVVLGVVVVAALLVPTTAAIGARTGSGRGPADALRASADHQEDA
ncbi:putative ABC transport system permease protein [Sediminihabitans luteus]|uniref:Putative ABC transport system permease protein n=1 Tax=Sediminihabitans luteus TaxID=1138585 RepID=A0A2M9CYP2_9CELL|nr:FtsX-like permease family protein [Sediminihabitans luteus]PJJ77017.1 putative ABC transport system permease protein [Sediminihabitans luteus]GII99659.1 hypothetical protein Slu03_20370 [Sediminihabitans luteus]